VSIHHQTWEVSKLSESYEVSNDVYDVVIVFYLLISGMNLFWMDAFNDVIGWINIDTGVKKEFTSVRGVSTFYSFSYMTFVGDKLYVTQGR
jgi:hypothetical protein